MPAARQRYQVLAVCGLLLLAVGLVFGQTVRHEFVNFDDDMIRLRESAGFTRAERAGDRLGVYPPPCRLTGIPLTWISYMLDCQLYGLNAGGHHLTNVLLHAATAILLFLVLRRMTGGSGRARWWRPSLLSIPCAWNRWPG